MDELISIYRLVDGVQTVCSISKEYFAESRNKWIKIKLLSVVTEGLFT